MYKLYIPNDIDVIQLFVTYLYLLKTNHFNKLAPCVFGVDDTFWYLALSIQIQVLTCNLVLCFANINQFCLICNTWSMIAEISSFLSKDPDTVSACNCGEHTLFSRVLPLRNCHGIIDKYPRFLYDASF